MEIHENYYGEDVEITYPGIISCATVTLELAALKFVGMHLVAFESNKIPLIVQSVQKGLSFRKIKNLYLTYVPANWAKQMKILENMKTSFPGADKYLLNVMYTYGKAHNLCFKFENGLAVITSNGEIITREFEEEWF